MNFICGYKLSEKQELVIKALYRYRCLTIEQLYHDLYTPDYSYADRVNNLLKRNDTKRQNLYKYLRMLEKERLITKRSLQPLTNKNYYYLTKAGLEVAYHLLNVTLEYKSASGFNNDLGEFSYELSEPPHLRIPHHLMTVDFLLILKDIKKEWNIEIQYRDNRYAAKEYRILEDDILKKYRLRPDAEFLLDSDINCVEIDRGTERLNSLKEKFAGYKRYFDFLYLNNRKLPTNILFVTNHSEIRYGYNRRFETVIKAFYEEMQDWATTVNLICCPIIFANHCIRHEIDRQKQDKRIYSYLKEEVERRDFIGDKLVFKSVISKHLNFDNVYYTLTNYKKIKTANIYVQVNGTETLGIARAIRMANYLLGQKHTQQFLFGLEQIKIFLCYSKQKPLINSFVSQYIDNKKLVISIQCIKINAFECR